MIGDPSFEFISCLIDLVVSVPFYFSVYLLSYLFIQYVRVAGGDSGGGGACFVSDWIAGPQIVGRVTSAAAAVLKFPGFQYSCRARYFGASLRADNLSSSSLAWLHRQTAEGSRSSCERERYEERGE